MYRIRDNPLSGSEGVQSRNLIHEKSLKGLLIEFNVVSTVTIHVFFSILRTAVLVVLHLVKAFDCRFAMWLLNVIVLDDVPCSCKY